MRLIPCNPSLGRFIFITGMTFFIGGFWVSVEISAGWKMILAENACDITCYYADWRIKLILGGYFAFICQILRLSLDFSLIAHFCVGHMMVWLTFIGL